MREQTGWNVFGMHPRVEIPVPSLLQRLRNKNDVAGMVWGRRCWSSQPSHLCGAVAVS